MMEKLPEPIQSGSNMAMIAKLPDYIITVDCRENFGNALALATDFVSVYNSHTHNVVKINAYEALVAVVEETTAILERIEADGQFLNDDGTPRFDEYDIAEWEVTLALAKGGE